MRGICAAVLLLAAALSLTAAQGPGYKAQFTAVAPGKASGSVLVLDVSSLWKKHPTQPSISTQEPGECQRRCSKLPGCTAWSFCKDPNGCGTGCSSHIGNNPAVSAITLESTVAPKRGERDMVPSTYKIPMNSFGPYTPHQATKGCQPGSPDKWAFGTCTLSKALAPNKVASTAEGAGWVSAWLSSPVPEQCAGLSAAACGACSSSPDPSGCLGCMRDKRSLSYIDNIGLVGDGMANDAIGSRTLDQCVSCAKLTSGSEKTKCVSCVLDAQACAQCIPYPGSATQLAASAQGPCMSCIEAKGKRFTGSCITCSSSPEPTKCIKCLDSFFPKLTCATSDYANCYKPDFDNPCATCQKVAPTSYDACISCFGKPSSKVDCESCSVLGSPSAQASCFKCSAMNPAGSSSPASSKDAAAAAGAASAAGGCGLCYAHSKNTALLGQCVDCLTDDSLSAEKRKFCSLCSSSELSGEQSARCFKCLEGKNGNAGCSTCSTTATTGPAFDACMGCRANAANGPDCKDCDSLGASLAPAARDALRKRCWECVVASKLVVPPDFGSAPLGSCSSCFASSSADTASCVACNTNAGVPSLAKGWCIACATKPAGQREACAKCLSSKKLATTYEYRAKCSI